MSTNLVLIIILGSIAFIFLIISMILYRSEQLIKNNSSTKTIGKVVSYSLQTTRAPVVEYWVNQQSYKKALFYSYTSFFTSPFSPVRAFTKDDLLDTKLRIRKNKYTSLNTLMNSQFPLGSKMAVYYNPDKPKLAYVERYAPNYLWLIFFAVACLFILTCVVIWLIR